jgi:hypothetical protein
MTTELRRVGPGASPSASAPHHLDSDSAWWAQRRCAFAHPAIRISNSHNFAISRLDMPELCKNHPPTSERAQGMPGARSARSRAWCVVNTRVSHHGHAGNTRHSPRNGFNGFLRALPGDRACLPPSSAELSSADLTPASGRQDHTTSPSASVPFVSDTATSTASRALRS